MKPLDRILDTLSIEPEEAPRIALLFLHSLFVGLFNAFFISVANALFLSEFDMTALPWAFIVSAAVGWLVIRQFSAFEKRVSFRALLSSQLLVLTALVLLFWLAVAGGGHWAFKFLMFVFIAPSLTLLNLEFWSLAARLFDLRQSKRLFGLVGTGEVVSAIVGFYLVPVLLRFVDRVETLLLPAAGGLVLSIAVVQVIARNFVHDLGPNVAPDPSLARQASLRELFTDRYFTLISLMVSALVLTLYFVDFGFLSEIQNEFETAAEMARMVSYVFGTLKVLELVMKAFFSGWFLSQFGLRWSLAAMPALLLACAGAGIALGGAADSDLSNLFQILVVTKIVAAVLKSSIFDPSYRVLYQPLPETDRLAFQARVEGNVMQAATGAAGLFLLVFSTEGGRTLHLLYLLLPILAGWILIVLALHGVYKSRLVAALSAHAQREEASSPVEILASQIRTGPPEDLRHLFNVLEMIEPTAVEPLLLEMLEHVLPQVRIGALNRLGERHAVGAIAAISEHLESETSAPVREAAAEVLRGLEGVRDLAAAPERVSLLASSRDAGDRETAAIALGWMDDVTAQRNEGLAELMWDRDARVRRQALISGGRLGSPQFWPQIVSHLAVPEYATTAFYALLSIGEPVLTELDHTFRRAEMDMDLRLRILNVYERIGGDEARALLRDKLKYPHKTVRHHVLCALRNVGLRHEPGHTASVRQSVAEIVGVMVWNIAAQLDLGKSPETEAVREALEAENAQNRSTLMLLLSLLYDPKIIKLVEENLESGVSELGVYALEILETVIDPELKPILFPALEDLRPTKRLSRLNALYPWQRMGRDQRLRAITLREHSKMSNWTKACALKAVGELARGEVPDVLLANLFHPDLLLQELAAHYIYRIGEEEYRRHLAKLKFEERERLAHIPEVGDQGGRHLTLIDKVVALAGVRGFSRLPSEILIKMAEHAQEVVAEPQRVLPADDDPQGTVYVVTKGFLKIASDSLKSGLISTKAIITARFPIIHMEAVEKSHLLRLDGDWLLQQMFEDSELLPAVMRAGDQRRHWQTNSLSSYRSSIMPMREI